MGPRSPATTFPSVATRHRGVVFSATSRAASDRKPSIDADAAIRRSSFQPHDSSPLPLTHGVLRSMGAHPDQDRGSARASAPPARPAGRTAARRRRRALARSWVGASSSVRWTPAAQSARRESFDHRPGLPHRAGVAARLQDQRDRGRAGARGSSAACATPGTSLYADRDTRRGARRARLTGNERRPGSPKLSGRPLRVTSVGSAQRPLLPLPAFFPAALATFAASLAAFLAAFSAAFAAFWAALAAALAALSAFFPFASP